MLLLVSEGEKKGIWIEAAEQRNEDKTLYGLQGYLLYSLDRWGQ